MNKEKEQEQSLKQRAMLNAYKEARRDLDWPTLDCAMSMVDLKNIILTKVFPKAPPNTPAG